MEGNKTKEFEFFGGSLNGFLMCAIALILWGCAIFCHFRRTCDICYSLLLRLHYA